MAAVSWRGLHGQVAGYAAIPLAVTAVTGLLFRTLQDVFGVDRANLKFLMAIHQGKLFPGSTVLYTLANGAALLTLIATGLTLAPGFWSTRYAVKTPRTLKAYHRLMSSVVAVPLAVSALSGLLYRFLRNALGMEKGAVGFLLDLHELNVLWPFFPAPGGDAISPPAVSLMTCVVLCLAAALLGLVVSGGSMLPAVRGWLQGRQKVGADS